MNLHEPVCARKKHDDPGTENLSFSFGPEVQNWAEGSISPLQELA